MLNIILTIHIINDYFFENKLISLMKSRKITRTVKSLVMNEARSDIYSSVCKAKHPVPTEKKLFLSRWISIFFFIFERNLRKNKIGSIKATKCKRSKDQLKGNDRVTMNPFILCCYDVENTQHKPQNIVAWWNSLSLFGVDLTIFSCWLAVALNSIPWFSIDIITATFHEVIFS